MISDGEAWLKKLVRQKEELIGGFQKSRERIIKAIELRYGKTAKGLEYLKNLFKDEFKKWEEKKEKMTDDEIMRFNEELMAKVHKREVQPLEEDGEKTTEGKATGIARRGSAPEMPSQSDSDDGSKPSCNGCMNEDAPYGTLPCDICVDFNNFQLTKKAQREASHMEDLYRLYRKQKYGNGNMYYLKKTTHPFTELNNMIHLGIGEIIVRRENLERKEKAFIMLYEFYEEHTQSAIVDNETNRIYKVLKEQYFSETDKEEKNNG